MRLQTLNGAPLCEQLDFSEDSLLPSQKSNTFHASDCFDTPDAATQALKWRGLTTKATRLRTGWSQPYLSRGTSQGGQSSYSVLIPNVEGVSDFPLDDTINPNTTITLDDSSFATTGFFQQSLIFHGNLLSSQVLQNREPDNTASSFSFLTSFGTTASSLSSPGRVDEHTTILRVPPNLVITLLGSLPTAHHLQSIYPQTPTPSFLCVLMKNPEQREILVRKRGYKMDLWEISIADHTRAGFKVSFWFRPPRDSNTEQTNAQSDLLHTLRGSKTGDILLLRNIALTSFREVVYGQSLNSAITRAWTSVDILMKSSGLTGERPTGLPPALAETFLKVKRWARTHIAADPAAPRKRKHSATKGKEYFKRSMSSQDPDDALPPDTMEAV